MSGAPSATQAEPFPPGEIDIACRGRTALFFAHPGERAAGRRRREVRARLLCSACPAQEPCRDWARRNREHGFWGGESEDERAAAGYPAPTPVKRVLYLLRAQGKRQAPSPDRSQCG